MIKNKTIKQKVYFIVIISILSALSTLLFFIGGLPIFVSFPYLKIDLSDVPALIGGIVFSPLLGTLIELIKNLVHLLMTHTLGIGELMSFTIGSVLIISFCLPFKLMYEKYSYKLTIVSSYLFCVLLTILIALIANSFIYRLFLSVTQYVSIEDNIMIIYLVAVAIVNFLKINITVVISLMIIKFSKVNLLYNNKRW